MSDWVPVFLRVDITRAEAFRGINDGSERGSDDLQLSAIIDNFHRRFM